MKRKEEGVEGRWEGEYRATLGTSICRTQAWEARSSPTVWGQARVDEVAESAKPPYLHGLAPASCSPRKQVLSSQPLAVTPEPRSGGKACPKPQGAKSPARIHFSSQNRTSSPCARCLSPEFSPQSGRGTCCWSYLECLSRGRQSQSPPAPQGRTKGKAALSHGVTLWALHLLELGWRKLLGAMSLSLSPLGPGRAPWETGFQS